MLRKGVSPVVASVLLVAVAVSLGILVTTWLTHWTGVQMTTPGITCSINTIYDIDSAIFNESGDNWLLVKVTNKGPQNIWGFGAVLDNGTEILRLNSTDPIIYNWTNVNLTEDTPLKREQSAYVKINLTNTTLNYPTFGSTLKEVKILNDACPAVSIKTTVLTIYPLT